MANFTGAAVSLDGYLLGGITNGGTGYEKTVAFTAGAEIADGDVWVIGRAVADDGSPTALHTAIDQVDSQVSHNGDDAWHLLKGTSDDFVTIDAAIGDVGDDPGSGFTICGDKATNNRSLIRKPGIDGASTWAESQGTDASDCQWTATNEINDIRDGGDGTIDDLDYTSVGSHTFVEPEAANN